MDMDIQGLPLQYHSVNGKQIATKIFILQQRGGGFRPQRTGTALHEGKSHILSIILSLQLRLPIDHLDYVGQQRK